MRKSLSIRSNRSTGFACRLVMIALVSSAGVAAALVASSAARAEDAADDPATLLRKARAAEAIERDPAKAIELYRKVFDTTTGPGVSTDTSRDAGLRLMELLEIRGERAAALEVAQRLSDRFGSRLDDDGKRRVHETMARLLPAGSHARSPLGEIYVVPSGPAAATAGATTAASPLDAKVLALLSRLDSATGTTERMNVEAQVLRDIAPVGRDALPVLEHVLKTERLERAQFAAKALARIGGAGSVAALASALKEGDGFTRSAAIAGFNTLSTGEDNSATIVKALDPLYADPALADVRSSIRDVLSRHLSDDELLRRHAAGGEDASAWLRVALVRQSPAALALAEDYAKTGGVLDKDLVRALQQASGATYGGAGNDAPYLSVINSKVSEAVRLQMLRAVAAQPPTGDTIEAVESIAAAVTKVGSQRAAEEARTSAWTHVLSAKDLGLRGAGVLKLIEWGVAPTSAIMTDESRVRAYAETWEQLERQYQSQYQPYTRRLVMAGAEAGKDAFWREVGEVATAAAAGNRSWLLLYWLGEQDPQLKAPDSLGPASLKAVELAVARDPSLSKQPLPKWLAVSAARTNDPAFARAVRTWLAAYAQKDWNRVPLLDALGAEYHGPDRADIVLEALRRGWQSPAATETAKQEAARGEIWKVIEKRLTEAKTDEIPSLVSAAWRSSEAGAGGPPAASLPFYVTFLARQDLPIDKVAWHQAATWAAQSGLPSFLELVRNRSREAKQGTRPRTGNVGFDLVCQLWTALDEYKGPGRLEFLRETLSTTDFAAAWPDAAIEDLVREDPAGAPALVVAAARRPERPIADSAVRWLERTGRRADLVSIFTDASQKPMPASVHYINALGGAALELAMDEAIPWLLRLVKEPASSPDVDVNFEPGSVIDSIHARHEALARYESYARGAASTRAEIESHLSDADPEIRRASILALSALGDRDVLVRLLTIAKEEKEPRVRQAALDAIERMANEPPRPSPTPAATSDKKNP